VNTRFESKNITGEELMELSRKHNGDGVNTNSPMTADEVRHALTYSQSSPFYIRSHYVVPEVGDGLGFNHRLDLLSIAMNSRIGTEIEIKVSKSDLKRDREKEHSHYDERIRQLYFAGPIELEEAFKEFAPPEAGIITVFHKGNYWQCVVRRRPKPRKSYKPFTEKEIFALLRLGNMRYWSLFAKQFK
jgi:hypothetical protein